MPVKKKVGKKVVTKNSGGKKTTKKTVKKAAKPARVSAKKQSPLTMTEQVEKVLDTVRPYLISDGGNIELLGVDEKNGVVTVHLVGACATCPSSQVTLYSGVEETLKEQVPGIVALVAV